MQVFRRSHEGKYRNNVVWVEISLTQYVSVLLWLHDNNEADVVGVEQTSSQEFNVAGLLSGLHYLIIYLCGFN